MQTPAPADVVLEEAVFALVNTARATARSCGTAGSFAAAQPLSLSTDLRCAARGHAADMAARDFFAHVTPEGLDLGDRLFAIGYSYSTAGENIAWGQPTAAEVMDDWLASAGHCRNIMDADFRELGVGIARDGSAPYWVQNFASP